MTRRFPPAVASTRTPSGTTPQVPRRFARAAVDLPAEYADEGQADWHASVIDDVGGGGVRLHTHEDLAMGTTLALRFTFGGTPISATVRVAMSLFDRSRGRYVHGVAFTAIDPRQRDFIVERIAALSEGGEP